jgi:D-glycero-D-manno-heptose 1,7-bisphosphate phosphatase
MLHWEIDSTWTLFLDRDGVINERIPNGYVCSTEEFHFLEGVLPSIAQLSSFFSHLFVVTNQQGIGKGLMTESNLSDIHRYMVEKMESMNGKITKCYHASALKNDPFSTRKPASSMALQAKEEFPGVIFEKSIMVGDTDSDILFGKNLGMKTVRIKTDEPIGLMADFTCSSLLEFSKVIPQ